MSVEESAMNVELRIIEKVIELSRIGFKIGGELAKQVIMFAMEKKEEHRENKVGKVKLKELLKNKDQINSFTISNKDKDNICNLLTRYKIQFSLEENKTLNRTRLFVKDSQLGIVKSAIEEVVEMKQLDKKNEELKKQALTLIKNNNVEKIEPLDSKKYYRHCINQINKDDVIKLKNILESNKVNTMVVVNNINDDKLDIEFKVDKKDKELTKTLIEQNLNKLKEDKVNKKDNYVQNMLNKASDKADKYNMKLQSSKKKDISIQKSR